MWSHAPSFSLLSNSCCMESPHFVRPFVCDGRLGRLHLLAVGSDAAISTGVPVSV